MLTLMLLAGINNLLFPLQAIQGSSLLQLSSDGTKVKRITPLTTSHTKTEMMSIYVVSFFANKLFLLMSPKENLPPNSNHDSLRDLFQTVGEVSYVSIPKWEDRSIKVMYLIVFPTDREKGFAFIEFKDKLSVDRAVKEMNQYDEEKNPNGMWILSK